LRDKIAGMIGLSDRAGKLIKGEENVLEAIRSGKARIVIVASDASDNTKKKFKDKCTYYRVDMHEYGTKVMLGHTTMAIGDENFANAVKKLINEAG